MFKFIKKKLKRWLEEDEMLIKNSYIELEKRPSIRSCGGTAFVVYQAHGGLVLETESYDERTDRTNRQLYVIREDQDFGHEINQILFLEKLKQ